LFIVEKPLVQSNAVWFGRFPSNPAGRGEVGGSLKFVFICPVLFVQGKMGTIVPQKQDCGSETINFGSGSYLEGHFASLSGSCPWVFSDPDPRL